MSFRVLIDDLVSCRFTANEFEPHIMLLRFIAGKNGDLGRLSEFAGQDTFDQNLPKRTGTACHKDPFTF